jgi:hypothetical protein
MFCSFKKITNTDGGTVSEKQKIPQSRLPLIHCTRDVPGHLTTVKITDIETKIDLILSRAGIFNHDTDDLQLYTICPRHRFCLAEVGIQDLFVIIQVIPERKSQIAPLTNRIQNQLCNSLESLLLLVRDRSLFMEGGGGFLLSQIFKIESPPLIKRAEI